MGAITVSNLSKGYKQYSSKWARALEWILPFIGKRHHVKWILKNLSFSVNSGEALGIVGINGAGKSTLLKIITGTVKTTKGSVVVNGKVAALLELGMGFHPDFTGRQNVYMAGQLLGYSTRELTFLMPEIEAFAEIGGYLDEPVRVYSSGMQVRLAFSIATARRPDILIIDEALSVGDSYFQQKSFERIRQYRQQGSTLLIVSHDNAAIQGICDRAILLNSGHIYAEGTPEVVMDYYNALLSDKAGDSITIEQDIDFIQLVSGTGEVKIISAEICNEAGEVIKNVLVGERIALKVKIKVVNAVDSLVVGYVIRDRLGQSIFGTNTHNLGISITNLQKTEEKLFTFNFLANLGVGNYSIAIALHKHQSHIDKNYEWRNYAVLFNVLNNKQQQFVGSNWLPPHLEIE